MARCFVVTGALLLVAAAMAAFIHDDLGGLARVLGTCGLGVLGVCAISRGVRLYRASVPASMPQSVGRLSVRVRPRLVSTAMTSVVALALPVAAAATLVAVVDWGWLAIAGGLLLGCLGLLVNAMRNSSDVFIYTDASAEIALLERLCMRADVPVPDLRVERDAAPKPGRRAVAFTSPPGW